MLLAGGTGLAPILSILRTMRSNGSRPLHLIYGVNTDDDAVELDTLEHLAIELGSLTWDYWVADQASSAVHKGFVTALIEPEHLYGGDVAVYLCGPPPMVEAVRKHLDAAGGAGRLLLRAVRPVGYRRRRARAEGPPSPSRSLDPRPGRGCRGWSRAPAGRCRRRLR